MKSLFLKLSSEFTNIKFQQEHNLSKYTTVKIGGPAEVFCETKDSKSFSELVSYTIKNKITFTILGWGANSLISDKGIRGLVIKNSSQSIKILTYANISTNSDESGKVQAKKDGNINDQKINANDNHNGKGNKDNQNIEARLQSDKTKGTFKYDFLDLDYNELDKPPVTVEIDSGVSLPFAINILINKGITGLQWYSRIPATLGGAIYNNIHGGTHFISEVIESVKVIDQEGNIQTINKKDLKAGYDESRFHHTNEIIVSAKLNLYYGDKEKAKLVSREWAIRKAIQPSKSLGCIFQNISNQTKEKLNYPTTSVGYIIEHILNKKGYQIGDAKISQKHAAFIENIGSATATDYLKLIKEIISETKIKTGVTLKPEIFFLGFTKKELKGII